MGQYDYTTIHFLNLNVHLPLAELSRGPDLWLPVLPNLNIF